jgi:hypothetical protein
MAKRGADDLTQVYSAADDTVSHMDRWKVAVNSDAAVPDTQHIGSRLAARSVAGRPAYALDGADFHASLCGKRAALTPASR